MRLCCEPSSREKASQKQTSPIQLTQFERDDTINTLNGDFYFLSATPRNYVLRRLDSSLAGTSAMYDRKTMSVEHVFPRNPEEGSEWSRWYPTAEIHTKWIHRLGNLRSAGSHEERRCVKLRLCEEESHLLCRAWRRLTIRADHTSLARA